MSLPKDTIIVGKSNSSASELLKQYNVPDHSYHFNSQKDKKISIPDIELSLALEFFNSVVSCKLNTHDGRKRLSTEEIERFKTMVSPSKLLHNALIMGENVKDLKIEINPEDKQIYLCRKNIVELSGAICQYTNVALLQICCNYLRYLPYGIGQMKNLKILILARNRISELPEEIGLCRDMREIDVSQNLLKKLPKSFSGLKSLHTLQISGNLIADLPCFLGKMQSLKYLNVSFNKITSIPLEIFKLPFLMSFTCNGCPLNPRTRKSFDSVGELTLKETTARHIIRQNLRIYKNTPTPLKEYILDVQECSFCGGPFFEHFVYVEDVHVFESEAYPVHYKMCCMHYKRHEDRLTTLFERSVPTFPAKIIDENLPSVAELFDPYRYDEEVLLKAKKESEECPTMPLICLAEMEKQKYRQNNIDTLFTSDFVNPNIFDSVFDDE